MLSEYLKQSKEDKSALHEFFLKYPKLRRGEKNIQKLKNM
jgi:hypothetical protein